jgi:hypothetical protein
MRPPFQQPPGPVDYMPCNRGDRPGGAIIAGVELCFINTVTTFGAAFDVTLEEIAVEAYFPADDDTARFFRACPAARGQP